MSTMNPQSRSFSVGVDMTSGSAITVATLNQNTNTSNLPIPNSGRGIYDKWDVSIFQH